MNSLNKVQILGNLTADPEVRETPNGQKVATFSIATNRVWKDAQGEKQEQVEYHNVVFWGKLADIVEQYLQKGKKAYVEGRLQTRSWEAQDGSKRYKTEIVAEELILLTPSGGQTHRATKEEFPADEVFPDSTAIGTQPSSPAKKRPPEEGIHIEDIPF